ncbi:3'-5' exonuclease [Pseudomonas auratipiscis]|uniref:3'-5' exonuclease n=1 Tax=Pseudomonas auratipiscis TaxID=3115853 RepID=A0AB35WRD6_9PSED|nr:MULTISPECIES: 3'-5' exonuclease [unclassified Pseudomonas]MEE1867007.1 3'-5' exonuclease [Pseudomonas sp. 120P]MEE1957834.1 3'-5' exonuclease [Pseudomonas sp. 119P]
MSSEELYISVDIEASGPIPGEFSMLSLGACVVGQAEQAIYIELKPDSPKHDPESLSVTGFDLGELAKTGLPPCDAMRKFAEWVSQVSVGGQKAIFVGLNAPFDWSFVNFYFHKYLGENPFGFAALDIKAFYMGAFNLEWRQTKSSHMAAKLQPRSSATHNALDDARFQAELFDLMLRRRAAQE